MDGAGEVPKEYIGRRNMLSYEDGVGTVLLTEGVHFVIDRGRSMIMALSIPNELSSRFDTVAGRKELIDLVR